MEQSINLCLSEFKEYFQLFGKKCSDFKLPEPINLVETDLQMNIDIFEENNLAKQTYSKLNSKQKEIFDIVTGFLEPPTNGINGTNNGS